MPIKVFYLEPTDRQRLSLRRFAISKTKICGTNGEYCHASVPFGESDILYDKDGYIKLRNGLQPPHDDPRWPTKCEKCGTPFTEDDEYQLQTEQIYARFDTSELMTLHDAPPGACWNAWWFLQELGKAAEPGVGHMMGDDKRCLVVRCPDGHDWMIDSRAHNCTMKEDRKHHCWVRHGRPEDGTLHVDKNGNTCGAGAGSIDTGHWHGFLHNGCLTT